MTPYKPQEIEKKWQNFWKKNKIFQAKSNSKKPKYYALDMFPYPSGAGLHVGHPLGMTATDIISRKKRMEGYEVLHPMGWDAFGLPAENYAIKTGVHPAKSTAENINNFRKQIQSLGFSYDWSREIDTTDPNYYQWTQDLFLKFYKKGLLYEEDKPMNWCGVCKVVCANEEVENGLHERCGNAVEKKALKQWMFRITNYAERLLQDLEKPKVILIHGWEGHCQNIYFKTLSQKLKKLGFEVISLDFPESFNPVYSDWADFFEENLKSQVDENTIFLGHSLGAGFLQRYFTENDLKAAQLIFCAPTPDDCEIDKIKNFFYQDKNNIFDYEKIKNSVEKITIFGSENDPYIPLEKFKKLSSDLSAEFVFCAGGEHLDFQNFEALENIFVELSKNILDWPEKIKLMQKNWIGKSEGMLFTAPVKDTNLKIQTFSAHFEAFCADTFVVIAPDHPRLPEILEGVKNKSEILDFCKKILEKRAKQGFEEAKESEGIFTGRYIVDPVGNGDLPIWVASFALADYGTGIVKCSGHDERDFAFAQKYKIPLKTVLYPQDPKEAEKVKNLEYCYTDMETGILTEPKKFAGQKSGALREKIKIYLEENNLAKRKVSYKLRDWIFTRQRYWGEPIPLIHCPDCGVLPISPFLEWQTEYFLGTQKKGGSDRLRSCDNACVADSYRSTPRSSTPISVTILGQNLVLCKSYSNRKYKYAKNFCRASKILSNKTAVININWRWIYKHFQHKKSLSGFSEVNRRAPWCEVVLEVLSKYDFSEKKESYEIQALAKDMVIKMILDRRNGRLYLTTFYPLGKLTKKISPYLPKNTLPLLLPQTANYEPSSTGESPLAKIEDWVNTPCPKCEQPAKRETSTMPNWAGSSWYWLRYMDTKNDQNFCSKEKSDYWGPVDLYVGGAEHAVLHLLYARFWHKALYDMGLVRTKEPFKKLVNQGMIVSYAYENKNGGLIPVDEVEEKDGKFQIKKTGESVKKITAKMSKSLKNVVNPDEIVKKYGADTLRLYEMFMGPFDQSKMWEEGALEGIYKFLHRIWRIFDEKLATSDRQKNTENFENITDQAQKVHHQTIKKVTEDIDQFKFNTAISQLMIWLNTFGKEKEIPYSFGSDVVRLLAPMAPHIAEEIWALYFQEIKKEKKSEENEEQETLTYEAWPNYDEKFLVEDLVVYAVQINGKVRGDFSISKDSDKSKVLETAKKLEKIQKYLSEGVLKKEIFVPGKIVGFVVK